MFTALIIAALIITGAVSVVGGGMYWAARRRNALPGGSQSPKLLGSGSASDLLERGFTDMRVNDVVLYDGSDFLIEGVIQYDEAGHRWSMANLVDGDTSYWLLVGLERSGSASKKLLQPKSGIDLNGYPPEVLVVEGERFAFDKRGTATTSLSGNTGSLGGGATEGGAHRCRWWNYQAPGGKALIVEQWGDDYRVLSGTSVGDTDLELMPAS